MLRQLARPVLAYTRWLHTRWPSGAVERLPELRSDGTTNVPGVRVVGDLTGIPLLKLSADSGARAIQAIAADSRLESERASAPAGVLDVAIVGAGVAGMAAALEARARGLRFAVFESKRRFQTIADFPRRKPIYAYPDAMTPAGELRFTADVKEALLEDLEAQTTDIEVREALVERIERRDGRIRLSLAGGDTVEALRTIVAIGRSGNFRKLGVPGEDLDIVHNRLHDPSDHADRRVLVVGGGDSALESAIALAQCGADVVLSYRKSEFSRPKPDNVERLQAVIDDPRADVDVERPTSERVTTAVGPFLGARRRAGRIRLAMETEVREIRDGAAVLAARDGSTSELQVDVVFSMIGREAPLDFFRRAGVRIAGEWTAGRAAAFAVFVAACSFVYVWKSGGSLTRLFQERGWFPFGIEAAAGDAATLLGTLVRSMSEPGFWYSMAYCLCVVVFGIARIRRRRTPYIRVQTLTLMAIQVVPLFVLPYILLPWIGHNGGFDDGVLRTVADALFPTTAWSPHGREYWRAFGLVLAWPLFIWNVFTEQPMAWWLVISFVQTFVLIPAIVFVWGKGAYCGWICSCGALAETLGDTHRHKMPHGPIWNRLNMVGQVILGVALLMVVGRVLSWAWPEAAFGAAAGRLFAGALNGWSPFGIELNYYHVVDVTLAGIVGVGFYFWFSGRVWCRFACPLAALMHVYARFGRFRILAEKNKCISCNVCTTVCHQGIDVMNFANKGLPMADPQCVRCSACVQSCPTGVLTFGRVGAGDRLIAIDRLEASPVQMREGR
jgi:thioredoxin reductase/ferredoxin